MSRFERIQKNILLDRLSEKRHLIQVVLGPRQVGKTTIVKQVALELQVENLFITGDNPEFRTQGYLTQQWDKLRKSGNKKFKLLIIDEVHKFDSWSDIVKTNWDLDTAEKNNIKVVLLGSAPLLIQHGLGESLFGRFETIMTPHWSYKEMKSAFKIKLEDFVFFGSYPGSFHLMKDEERFKNFINDSVIETTLSKDIQLLKKIDKPALLRKLFYICCEYSGQIVTFQKMLGQLQDVGNTTTLAHYLDLLQQVGMVVGLQKFSGEKIRQRASPPKLQVFNNALMAIKDRDSLKTAIKDKADWGRRVESSVGCQILSQAYTQKIEVYYWREGDHEIDFILKRDDQIVAIEVKTGEENPSYKAFEVFKEKYPKSRLHVIGNKYGFDLLDFFQMDLNDLMK
jgi:predicted AAA+ superfamily ATPase